MYNYQLTKLKQYTPEPALVDYKPQSFITVVIILTRYAIVSDVSPTTYNYLPTSTYCWNWKQGFYLTAVNSAEKQALRNFENIIFNFIVPRANDLISPVRCVMFCDIHIAIININNKINMSIII